MIAVFVTALTTWLLILFFNYVDIGGLLLEGTIAVLGGMAVGLLVPWYLVRRRRQAR